MRTDISRAPDGRHPPQVGRCCHDQAFAQEQAATGNTGFSRWRNPEVEIEAVLAQTCRPLGEVQFDIQIGIPAGEVDL